MLDSGETARYYLTHLYLYYTIINKAIDAEDSKHKPDENFAKVTNARIPIYAHRNICVYF